MSHTLGLLLYSLLHTDLLPNGATDTHVSPAFNRTPVSWQLRGRADQVPPLLRGEHRHGERLAHVLAAPRLLHERHAALRVSDLNKRR